MVRPDGLPVGKDEGIPEVEKPVFVQVNSLLYVHQDRELLPDDPNGRSCCPGRDRR
jgi:hypothetical protein